ncbi:hypothetical protein CRH09_32780 [Nocardia terpenica]|uniref:Uncharacterized protein n=1 Tax=Nocardia terpenica TaxID=455432 RepID=A0A291RSP8_9NOCA|nr:hypothetical protein CRH09_32780 [Nocardia terpenica]
MLEFVRADDALRVDADIGLLGEVVDLPLQHQLISIPCLGMVGCHHRCVDAVLHRTQLGSQIVAAALIQITRRLLR